MERNDDSTFGEMLRALLVKRGISQRELARRTHYDPGYLSRVVRDQKPPSPGMAEALDATLDADGALIAAASADKQRERSPQGRHPSSGLSTASVEETDPADDWGEMERRRLLQLAALGLGTGTLASSGEPVRQLLDLVLASESRSIGDWGLACADHLHALRTRPPAEVRDGLSIDLLAIQRQLTTTNAKDTTELQRVLAALATLHANVLTRLGDHGSAVRWWRTAKSAADASGDLNVRMMVRCEEAGFGLYGQRDLTTVLSLTDKARQLSGDTPSLWFADLAGTRAKALTLLGRHAEARHALNIFVSWTGEEASGDIIPSLWSADQAHFAASWVYAGSGNETEADTAREHVLAAATDYQYAANVRLHEAVCTVVQGGIDQGARQAATILDSIPLSYRSQMITETGKRVLRAIPADRSQHPAVSEFREVLTATAPDIRVLTSGA